MATSSQTVGPFFHFALADNTTLGCLVRDDTRGERIRLRIRVFDGDGAPVPDALIELWQADADGVYVRLQDREDVLTPPASAALDVCRPGRTASVCSRRFDQRARTSAERDAQGRTQASHINVCLLARGSCGRSTRASTSRAIRTSNRMRARARSRRPAPYASRATGRSRRVGLRPPASGRRRNRVLRSLISKATCHHG